MEGLSIAHRNPEGKADRCEKRSFATPEYSNKRGIGVRDMGRPSETELEVAILGLGQASGLGAQDDCDFSSAEEIHSGSQRTYEIYLKLQPPLPLSARKPLPRACSDVGDRNAEDVTSTGARRVLRAEVNIAGVPRYMGTSTCGRCTGCHVRRPGSQ